MVLQDWQRGKIPFFIAPPRLPDNEKRSSDEKREQENNEEKNAVDGKCVKKDSSILAAIETVVKKQQKTQVPVQKNFFNEEDEGAEELVESEDLDASNKVVGSDEDNEATADTARKRNRDDNSDHDDDNSDCDENLSWEEVLRSVQSEMGADFQLQPGPSNKERQRKKRKVY